MDKAQQYLCLARKAGFLSVGEESCGAVTESGKARLLLLANDTAPNTARRVESSLAGHRALLMTLPWTKAELAALLGKAGCSVVCFTDLALAGRFASAMAEELPEWQETAELLAQRADKARKRKAAPRKHENRRK